MTKVSVLFWQDIPTVIEARDLTGIEKVELSKRFSELVDLVAMKKGLIGTDDYLQNWKKKRLPSTEKSAKQAVLEMSKYFERKYKDIKLKALQSLD
ncbi:MAG: virulence factor [Paracoccaceae bacterium]